MERPHASSHVILKANINQFCIVDRPRAVINTCSVFVEMDVHRHLSAQTSNDNCEDAHSVSLSFIVLVHTQPCSDPGDTLPLRANARELFSMHAWEMHQEIDHLFKRCRYELSNWWLHRLWRASWHVCLPAVTRVLTVSESSILSNHVWYSLLSS